MSWQGQGWEGCSHSHLQGSHHYRNSERLWTAPATPALGLLTSRMEQGYRVHILNHPGWDSLGSSHRTDSKTQPEHNQPVSLS